MTQPNQFNPPESRNHDATKHIWGKSGTPIPQYSTLVQPNPNHQIHDPHVSESHLNEFRGPPTSPTPTNQDPLIDLSNVSISRSPHRGQTYGYPRKKSLSPLRGFLSKIGQGSKP